MELDLWLERALQKIEDTSAESLIQNLKEYGLVEPLSSSTTDTTYVIHYNEAYSGQPKDRSREVSVISSRYYRTSVDRFYTQKLTPYDEVSAFDDTMQLTDYRLCEAA